MAIYIIMIMACACIGYAVDGWRGVALGALLGPIGLVISAIIHGKESV